MPASDNPEVIKPKVEPFHEQGQPLNLDYKIVFATTSARRIGESINPKRDGRYHLMTIDTGHSGNNKNEKFDKAIYFNCDNLKWDGESQRISETSQDEMMNILEFSVLFFINQLQESIISNNVTSGEVTASRIPGTVTIDLAVYHPLSEMAIAWCEIFDAPWYKKIEEFAFIRDYASINLAHHLEPIKKAGWTIIIEYVGFADLVWARGEMEVEKNARLLQEEQEKIAAIEAYEEAVRERERARERAKKEQKKLEKEAFWWGFSGIVLGAACIVGSIFFPPLAPAFLLIGVTEGTVIASALTANHVQQVRFEEMYAENPNYAYHYTSIGFAWLSVVPVGAGATKILQGAEEGAVMVISVFLDVNNYAITNFSNLDLISHPLKDKKKDPGAGEKMQELTGSTYSSPGEELAPTTYNNNSCSDNICK